MTGPGARLDAENDNLQAYCTGLEAEIGALRDRITALEQVLQITGSERNTTQHEVHALRQQLRDNLAALHCDRTAYPVFVDSHHRPLRGPHPLGAAVHGGSKPVPLRAVRRAVAGVVAALRRPRHAGRPRCGGVAQIDD